MARVSLAKASITALLLGTAGSLGLVPTTAASLPPQCSSSFDVYQSPASLLEACGIKTFPRIATLTLADGATSYVYDVAGSTYAYTVPPQGFDAATASDQQLKEFGLPLRPSIASQVPAWSQMVGNEHFVTPPPFLATIPVQASTAYSQNWAGYIAYGSAGPYSESDVQYNEPSLSPSYCSSNSVVFWAGLGGDGVSQLAQDGTGENTASLKQNQAWSEVLPAEPDLVPTNLFASVGYGFYASVTYYSGGTFTMYLDNTHTNAAQQFNVSKNGYNGSTAEAIVERPTSGGSVTNLSNFGTMTFTTATADLEAMGGLPNYRTIMSSNGYSSGTPLATPSSLYNSGSSFQVTQDHCN